jgi:hypothetical protein
METNLKDFNMYNVRSSLANLAIDTLSDAEVMQEFDDTLWVKIDRELWEMFQEQLNDRSLVTFTRI